MNVQGATIDDPESLMAYDPAEDPLECHPEPKDSTVALALERLLAAKRPVVYVGGGIRASGAHANFMRLLELLRIPVVTGWNAHDVIADDHPLYAGRPGILGDRPGNFTVQNADHLLVLGSRLSVRQVGYNWKSFAPHAFITMVDIDPLEFCKHTIAVDLPIRAHLPLFIDKLRALLDGKPLARWEDWIAWTQERRTRYPAVLPRHWDKESPVNPYCLVKTLFERLPDDQIVIAGDGTACVVGFQAAIIKQATRFFHNSGCASMGFDLPAAIGAAVAKPGQPILCLTGDGSIQLNLQELQTIVGLDLPVKIVLINNNGYHSIRQTQSHWFGEPLVGVGPQSGVTFPDMEKIAAAYGFPYRRVETHAEMTAAFDWTLSQRRAICEVFVDIEQQFEPKAASRTLEDGTMVSAPLEDLAPFLSREELAQNMIPRG
jgi:acetolactate synthase-1/2/3 large subunit